VLVCVLTYFVFFLVALAPAECPFNALQIASFVATNREGEFVKGKMCLFCNGNFTMWVTKDLRERIVKYVVEKRGKAVTEGRESVCFVRVAVPISIEDACKLLTTCKVSELTVMQFGQKADFNNKAVQWALKNVRECLSVFGIVLTSVFSLALSRQSLALW
jgi:hypothetical protein